VLSRAAPQTKTLTLSLPSRFCFSSLSLPFPSFRTTHQKTNKNRIDSFWAGKSTAEELTAAWHDVEKRAWTACAQGGAQRVALDSTLYDQVLDAISWLGLTPERFQVRESERKKGGGALVAGEAGGGQRGRQRRQRRQGVSLCAARIGSFVRTLQRLALSRPVCPPS